MKDKKNIYRIVKLLSIPLLCFILWYTLLPAINLRSIGFWIYAIIVLTYASLIAVTFNIKCRKLFLLPIVLTILMILLIMFSNPMFNSKQYANLIQKQNGSFEKDVKEASFEQVPTVDRDTAQRLGSRKMGEMLDLVSQYNVSNSYT